MVVCVVDGSVVDFVSVGSGFSFLSSVVVVVLAAFKDKATLLPSSASGTAGLEGKGVDGRCRRRQHLCTDYATR